MQSSPKTRRRIFGAACLAAAVLLLLFGNTKPKPGQPEWLFVAYWVACFLFLIAAMITAIRDFGALQREARDEQRELLQSTLETIEAEKRRRQK